MSERELKRAAERLAEEDGIELGVETLRGWMLEEESWSRVTVCEWEDGTREIHYRGRKLKWKEIGGRAFRARRRPRPTTRKNQRQ